MSRAYRAAQAPELEHSKSISQSFDSFQQAQLSKTTSISYVHYRPDAEPEERTLRSRADITGLPHTTAEHGLEFFFVHKGLAETQPSPAPEDREKLQISSPCFEALATRLLLPSAFIFSLSRHHLPNGRGFRHVSPSPPSPSISPSPAYECWYFLPVRVQVEPQPGVADDHRGAGQMNPFHKLHLPDVQLNILRSCVGVFARVDPATGRATAATFDFMHGRWPRIALEPKLRVAEVARHQRAKGAETGGASVHLVYASSAARWWTNSLNSVNEQLIAYEVQLQSELDAAGVTPEEVLTRLSRALHSVSAHLHRYLSELASLRWIITDVGDFYETVYARVQDRGRDDEPGRVKRGFRQVLSQVEASLDFATELEKKTQNILDLLFNRIQINSDRLLVANGRAMEEILKAMQADASTGRQLAKASHELAIEMKRDSIAMRTIAIITMAFLPGATFAAVLSMPFFSEDRWLKEAGRFWVWILITVPATAGCFTFYRLWRQKSLRRIAAKEAMADET